MTKSHIRIEFSPSVALVGHIRQFTMDFFRDHVAPGALPDRVGVTVHELLENTFKHSFDGMSELRIDVVPESELLHIVIATKNRVRGSEVDSVKRRFEELERSTDPLQYYRAVMERSRELPVGESGLGLARIWCEAEMQLHSHWVDDELEIVAETMVSPKAEVRHDSQHSQAR